MNSSLTLKIQPGLKTASPSAGARGDTPRSRLHQAPNRNHREDRAETPQLEARAPLRSPPPGRAPTARPPRGHHRPRPPPSPPTPPPPRDAPRGAPGRVPRAGERGHRMTEMTTELTPRALRPANRSAHAPPRPRRLPGARRRQGPAGAPPRPAARRASSPPSSPPPSRPGLPRTWRSSPVRCCGRRSCCPTAPSCATTRPSRCPRTTPTAGAGSS